MKILNWIKLKWEQYQLNRRYKKKIKEIKKRDPFTYNH
jgi:hypothetical protein